MRLPPRLLGLPCGGLSLAPAAPPAGPGLGGFGFGLFPLSDSPSVSLSVSAARSLFPPQSLSVPFPSVCLSVSPAHLGVSLTAACPLLCLSPCVVAAASWGEACLPQRPALAAHCPSPCRLSMTPPGQLYLLGVCGAPLLLLGLLLALPPEAQVRQQEKGVQGWPSRTLGPRAPPTLFSLGAP